MQANVAEERSGKKKSGKAIAKKAGTRKKIKYPEVEVTPMITLLHYDRLHTLPIKLFEEGRAGHEVNTAPDWTIFNNTTSHPVMIMCG